MTNLQGHQHTAVIRAISVPVFRFGLPYASLGRGSLFRGVQRVRQ
jgi:hypothetical protein